MQTSVVNNEQDFQYREKIVIPDDTVKFYLLEYGSRKNMLLKRKFEKYVDELSWKFLVYNTFAVVGELRHGFRYKDPSFWKEGVLADFPLVQKIAEFVDNNQLHSYSHIALVSYKNEVLSFSCPQLFEEARKIFRQEGWYTNYGGELWARICDVTLLYYENPVVFVDQCWSLEHNTGTYLNKSYNTFWCFPYQYFNELLTDLSDGWLNLTSESKYSESIVSVLELMELIRTTKFYVVEDEKEEDEYEDEDDEV